MRRRDFLRASGLGAVGALLPRLSALAQCGEVGGPSGS